MHTPPASLAATLAVALLTACVSVNKSVLAPGLPPVPAADVQVYFETDSLPEHTRVAILNAQGSSGFTNHGQMIDKLREEAGKLGANAIVLMGIAEPGTGEKVLNALVSGMADGQRRGEAIAIRVKEGGAMTGSAASAPEPTLGRRALEKVYADLTIDEEWSVRAERSFAWSAHQLVQVFREEGPWESFGTQVTRVSATTLLVEDVEKDDATVCRALGLFNRLAVGDALVWDPEGRRVLSHTAVLLHDEVYADKVRELGAFAILGITFAEVSPPTKVTI